jgi:hypothetical protein
MRLQVARVSRVAEAARRHADEVATVAEVRDALAHKADRCDVDADLASKVRLLCGSSHCFGFYASMVRCMLCTASILSD